MLDKWYKCELYNPEVKSKDRLNEILTNPDIRLHYIVEKVKQKEELEEELKKRFRVKILSVLRKEINEGKITKSTIRKISTEMDVLGPYIQNYKSDLADTDLFDQILQEWYKHKQLYNSEKRSREHLFEILSDPKIGLKSLVEKIKKEENKWMEEFKGDSDDVSEDWQNERSNIDIYFYLSS